MSQEVRAIYENGLFRPLDPVSLADQVLVSLTISGEDASMPADDLANAEQQRVLREALDEADRLPLEGPNDGFSGADHDLILYGWKK